MVARTARRSTSAWRRGTRRSRARKGDEEPSGVEVWHPKDFDVISAQKLQLARDRDRNVAAAWHVEQGRVVPLGTNVRENMLLPRTGTRAVAVDETPYDSDGMFGRRWADVYKVDLASGERAKIAARIPPPVWPSPGGRYVLNFKDGEYIIYDLQSGAQRNVSRAAGVSFIDKQDDHLAPNRPPYGVAGWTKNDTSVIVYDECDLWQLFPDGAKPRPLDEWRHRTGAAPVRGSRGAGRRGPGRTGRRARTGADRSREAGVPERDGSLG